MLPDPVVGLKKIFISFILRNTDLWTALECTRVVIFKTKNEIKQAWYCSSVLIVYFQTCVRHRCYVILLNDHFADCSTRPFIDISCLPPAGVPRHISSFQLPRVSFSPCCSACVLLTASPPPILPSHTHCLTHLLSAHQVPVAKRQAVSDGLLLWEWRLSITVSSLYEQ